MESNQRLLVGGFEGFLKTFLSRSAALDFEVDAFLAAENRFWILLAFASRLASSREAALLEVRENSTTLPPEASLLSLLKTKARVRVAPAAIQPGY